MDRPAKLQFSAIPRPAFGKHAQHAEDKAAAAFRGKAGLIRMAMFDQARELLTSIPAPGESLYAFTGNVDLCVILMQLIDAYPARCLSLKIATLAFHMRNAVELLGALESNRIGTFSLLTSHFHAAHYRELHSWLREEFNAFPGRATLAVARNHAKVSALVMDDGAGLVTIGSGNLRRCGNAEALAIVNDRRLADWYSQWIDAQVRNDGNRDNG